MTNKPEKLLVWLKGEVKTPPFSFEARLEAGFFLRKLQQNELLSMPHSRPMYNIGSNCHELRINDKGITWRIIYRLDEDAIIILDVFKKKTDKTPLSVIRNCQKRLKNYDNL